MRFLGFDIKIAGTNDLQNGPTVDDTRKQLALSVTRWGMLCVAGVSVVAIAFAASASSEKVSQVALTVLTSVLPVIGTWVGTVLAFYFARENFEVASRASERLLAGRSDRLAVDFAIKVFDIEEIDVSGKTDSNILLQDIRARLDAIGRYRVPLMTDSKTRVRYVVHRQPLETYLISAGLSPTATLADLLLSPIGEAVKNGIAYVAKDATLGEAKAAMDGRSQCQDVFITETGRPSDNVVAWLTNNDLQRALQA